MTNTFSYLTEHPYADVRKDKTSSIKDEHVALGRALSAVGFFAAKPRTSIIIGSEKELLPSQIK